MPCNLAVPGFRSRGRLIAVISLLLDRRGAVTLAGFYRSRRFAIRFSAELQVDERYEGESSRGKYWRGRNRMCLLYEMVEKVTDVEKLLMRLSYNTGQVKIRCDFFLK